MDKQQIIILDASILIGELIQEYIDNFKFRDPRKTENLINASFIEEPTMDEVKGAIWRILNVMKDIEYDATSMVDEYVNRRKKIEQIKSILLIGRSHPDSAIKRLKGLKPKYAKC
jgi:hypothetical protein